MSKIVISIPDSDSPRIVDAFCSTYVYQTKVPDEKGVLVDNPESREDFTNTKIGDYVKQIVKDLEGSTAASEAKKVSDENVDALQIDVAQEVKAEELPVETIDPVK